MTTRGRCSIAPACSSGWSWSRVIFGVLVGRQFFAPGNLELMARQTAIVCMAALGMTIVIVAGGIDLSVGSMIALTTVVIALMLRAEYQPAGRGDRRRRRRGALRLRQRRPHHAAQGRAVHRHARHDADRARRGEGARRGAADRGADHLAERSAASAAAASRSCPPASGRSSSLALVVAGVLRYTRFGRHVFAIGSNERMARLCGVAISRTKIVVYTMSAALVGHGRPAAVLEAVGRRSDRGGRARARRHRRGHHRRRQPDGRTRNGARHAHRRRDHDHHPDRLLAEGAARTGSSRSSPAASSSSRSRSTASARARN